jgi:AcrR family transcriptional regulator
MNSQNAIRDRPRRTQAERTEESGQRMLEAGIRLILERGPQKTTLKDVGELAGYSRGLASYRFGSKEGLFEEILALGRQQWSAELRRAVSGKRGLDALLAATDAFKGFLTNMPHHYRAMLILWYESIGRMSPVAAKLRQDQAAQRRDVQRWIEQGIADGRISPEVKPEQCAAGFLSLVFGTAYQWQLNPEAFDLDLLFSEYERWLNAALRL